MVIDVHAHLWRGNVEKNRQDLLEAVRRFDVARVYLSGIGAAYPDKEEIELMNGEIEKFIKEYPEHFSGYVYINPDHDNALDVMKRGIEEQGMTGLKLWIATFCDKENVDPLMDLAAQYGIPVLVHAFSKAGGELPNESVGTHVANIARRHPKTKILMAHLGGNAYMGIPPIRDLPNVWTDLCCSIFRGDELPYTLEQVGADRVLFGTDMPGSYLVNLGQIEDLDLSQEDRDKLLYKNAQKIFDPNFRL